MMLLDPGFGGAGRVGRSRYTFFKVSGEGRPGMRLEPGLAVERYEKGIVKADLGDMALE